MSLLKLVRELATFVLGLVELLLTFRFLLKLLAASPRSEIVNWIYDTTAPLLQPFLFAFPTPTVKGGFTLEFTTLFAIFAYAFVAYLIDELLNVISSSGHRTKK